MKDYLRARGVEFDVINFAADPEAQDDLVRHKMFRFRVIAKGDTYIVADQTSAIDRLFGWESESRKLLPMAELFSRMSTLLGACVRYGRQLPAGHYDDVIPGQEGLLGPMTLPDGTVLRLADGQPYMPHHTSIRLFRHLMWHSAKFLPLLQHPDLDVYERMAALGPLAEPSESITL